MKMAYNVACPLCGRGPYEVCKKSSGVRTDKPHAARVKAASEDSKSKIHPNSLATLAKYQMPLGETQRSVLQSLAKSHRGFWHSGCGWLWDTPSGTRKIMETLAKRGLVTKTMVPYTHTPACTYPRYDLTDEGRRVAEEPRDPA